MRESRRGISGTTGGRSQRDSQQPTKSKSAGRAEETQTSRESEVRGDFSHGTFERHAAMLGDVRISQPMHARERASFVLQLRRDYGNGYVQRLVGHISRQQTPTIRGVQTKLQVGSAGDEYEQEADRVAKQVVSITLPQGDRSTQRLSEDEELQMKPVAQRQPEEEELQMKPVVQRQISPKDGEVDSEVEGVIKQAKGSGQAIPDNVRRSMEGAFGADFSGVKVHTGAESNALNESISARAFTTGQDIFFNKGEYNPVSSAGQETLAHELTHVVQQNGSTVRADEQPINRIANLQRQDIPQVPEEEKEDFLTPREEQEWLQAKPQIQRQDAQKIQRAWTGRRQLSGLGGLGMPWVWRKKGNIFNLGLYHEHIFFQDDANGNVGHLGKAGLGPDTAHGEDEYAVVRADLDDALMRRAVEEVGDPGDYTLLSNNCQAYVQNVLAVYDRLASE